MSVMVMVMVVVAVLVVAEALAARRVEGCSRRPFPIEAVLGLAGGTDAEEPAEAEPAPGDTAA
jgi:hypothetical protein